MTIFTFHFHNPHHPSLSPPFFRIKKIDFSENQVGKEGSEVLGAWLSGLEGFGELERLVLVGCGLVGEAVLKGVQKVR